METKWRNRIYDNYVTNIFELAHSKKGEMNLQYKYFKKNYLKYLPVNKDAKILELGCGMGHFYNFLYKNGYNNYTGVDLSEENIEYIRKNINESADIIKMDMYDYFQNCENDQFDVVVFNDVIEHLTKDEIIETLDQIYRVLKKGGVFLVKTINQANPYVAAASVYICFDHEIGFTETSMLQLLKTCGYTDIKIVGTDIYVLNPILNVPARLLSRLINLRLRFLSVLYGRTTIKIFDKDILGVAYK